MATSTTLAQQRININKHKIYIEGITRLREDMDCGRKQYREHKIYENIKSISLSYRVMFYLLYGILNVVDKIICGNNKFRSMF